MEYALYPLVMARDGRKLGEFPLGTISFSDEEGIKVECPDIGLNRRLSGYFNQVRRVRRALGATDKVFTYVWEDLEPGSEEYFRESMARLHCLGFIPKELTS
ncbi:MAG: hypothetical protein ACI38Q_05265 [Candidatus Bruticola sp.]